MKKKLVCIFSIVICVFALAYAGTALCPECGGKGQIEERCNICYGNGYKSCPACGGVGITNMFGQGPHKCGGCNGTGKLRCSACYGRGYKVHTCYKCNGRGQISTYP